MKIYDGVNGNVFIDFSLVNLVQVDIDNLNVIFVISSDDCIVVHRSNYEGVFKVIDRMVKFNGDSVKVVYI